MKTLGAVLSLLVVACMLVAQEGPANPPVMDAAIENLQVQGRDIQRLWWENDVLLFSLSGPAVLDIYAKTQPDLVGRKVFTGAKDENRRVNDPNLIPLTPQGDTFGAAAWLASMNASDRQHPIRPWTYNSFTDDRSQPHYDAHCGFQANTYLHDRLVCEGFWGRIPTAAVPIRGTLSFETRPGEHFVRMVLGAPGPMLVRDDPGAPPLGEVRIGLGVAALDGEKQVRRGKNYLASYAEPSEGAAHRIGLAIIYSTAHGAPEMLTPADGRGRILYFRYEPDRYFGVSMWLVAGWDGDGSCTSGDQWESYVKALAEKFDAEHPPSP